MSVQVPAFLAVGVLLMGAMIVGFAVLFVYALRKNQQRVGSLAGFAQAAGLTYTPHDPYDLPARWRGLPFEEGYGRAASNVVTGRYAGRPLVAFDYSYTDRDMDGDTSTTAYGVVALSVSRALPDVAVLPENVLTRIVRALGLPDAKVGDEEFDKRHHVLAADPVAATALLTPGVRAHLTAYGQVHLRFAGTDLVSWGPLLDPAELDRRARLLAAVADELGG